MAQTPTEEEMFKEFILCEMIHDFKTDRKNRPKGEVIGADVINYTRYSFYADRFEAILDSGIPVSVKTNSSYNDILHCSSDNVEDVLLRYIANTGSENLQDFIKKQVSASGIVATTITTRAPKSKLSNVYTVKGIESNKITGIKLYETIKSSKGDPIFLIDTGSIIRDLKKGKADHTKKAYIFSPLVTMCDPAGGLDPIDGLSTSNNKVRFATHNNSIGNGNAPFTGIRLINVYSTSDYEISHSSQNKFFSNFDIKITYDALQKKLKQKWTYSGTQTKYPIGVGPPGDYKYPKHDITYEWFADSKTANLTSFSNTLNSHTFEPANILNSQPNCFNFIRQYINAKEDNPPKPAKPGNSRWIANENKLMNTVTFDNRVALALALQRKRAGDWLPVSYILDYDSITQPQTTQPQTLIEKNWDNSNTTAQKEVKNQLPSTTFKSQDMFIVTLDRPLVAYCLFRGVNVIYYMNGFGPVIFRKN